MTQQPDLHVFYFLTTYHQNIQVIAQIQTLSCKDRWMKSKLSFLYTIQCLCLFYFPTKYVCIIKIFQKILESNSLDKKKMPPLFCKWLNFRWGKRWMTPQRLCNQKPILCKFYTWHEIIRIILLQYQTSHIPGDKITKQCINIYNFFS